MYGLRNGFTPAEIRTQRKIRGAIGVLLSIHPTMPLQLAWTYLQVVSEEGRTVSALARRCGVDATVMSRHLQDLSNVNRHRKAGLGLIELTSNPLGDLRERRAVLSKGGVNLMRRIIAELKASPTKNR